MTSNGQTPLPPCGGMQRIVPVALLVLIGMLAGCTEAATEYQIRGAFTTDRSDDDIAALSAKAKGLGGEVAIMESFPEQFLISGLPLAACKEMAAWLDAQDFIASATPCQET